MLGLYIVVFISFVSLNMDSVNSEYMTKIVCFGQRLKLICDIGKTLQIRGASYEMLDATSQYCRHLSQADSGCNRSQMTQRVQNICDGRGVCSLGYGVNGRASAINCHTSMYLNVSYRCAARSVLGGGGNLNPITHPDTYNNFNPPKTDQPSWRDTRENMAFDEDDGSLYFTLLRLFVQFRVAGEYMANHSLWLVLCVVASFAIGILILILYALTFKFYTKYRSYKKQKQHEETPRHVEILSPITQNANNDKTEKMLITRHNDTPFSDTSIASDSALLSSPKSSKDDRCKHQIISTIRRTHSVDEQTQTNIDETQPVSTPTRTLSATEMQELGYLVADLKVYESQIEDSIIMSSKPSTSRGTSSRGTEYDNVQNFFFSGDPCSSSSCADNRTFRQHHDKYLTPFPTNNCGRTDTMLNGDRTKYNTHHKELRRYPSEISYETSASNASDENNIKESYFLGDAFRLTSMQRNHKLGVRGDGFDFIGGDSRPR